VAALGLSPRELEVLGELLAGRSNQEIAERLGVSLNTVKTHVARLLGKLGAKRRGDAVARARELGILR
jgi:ATP/maltotriose-dependent transcriptional regulator MalT